MLKRFLDSLFTAVVLVLAVPTTLILISWNAIPGDKLYPLKSGLENIVMAAVSGTPLAPKVSMKFTDRRIGEATKLLDQKGSTVGYDLLVANARETQNYIVDKNDISAGVQFTKNIDNYKKEIAKKKVEVTAEIQAGAPAPTPTSIPTPVIATPTPEPVSVSVNVPESTVNQTTGQTVTVNVPQTVVITQENPTEVLQKLNSTENELNQIQDEIKKNADKKDSEKRGKDRGQGN